MPCKRGHTGCVRIRRGGSTVKKGPFVIASALVLAAGVVLAPGSAMAQRSGGSMGGAGFGGRAAVNGGGRATGSGGGGGVCGEAGGGAPAGVWSRGGAPPSLLQAVLPVRGGGSGGCVGGSVLPASVLLSAALLRSAGLQRTRDVQPTRELRAAAAESVGLGRAGAAASAVAAFAERRPVRDRPLR